MHVKLSFAYHPRFHLICSNCEHLTAVCQHFQKIHAVQGINSGKCSATITLKFIKVYSNIYVVLTSSFKKYLIFLSSGNVSTQVCFAHQ